MDDELSPFEQNQTKSNLVVLRETLRRKEIHPIRERSKIICDPRRILEVGNHWIWEFLNEDYNSAYYVFEPEVALLYHYRRCSDYYDKSYLVEGNFVVDRTIFKYEDELVDRITNTRDKYESCLIKTQAKIN